MPKPDADHAAHDRLLVAARAARDPALTPAEVAAADALLAACPECATLSADLVALAAALPIAATPRRIRDFTLTAADTERLRPRGVRAWLARIGSTRDTLTKPLAVGFTTLGLAGLLVATAPTVLPLAGGSAGGDAALAPAAASAAPAATNTENLAMSAAPAASPVDDGEVFNGSDSSDPPRATEVPGDAPSIASPSEEAAVRDDASGWSILMVIAGSSLIVGLGLFALRWSARRFGD
jgi:anti-sigma factor RsiW